MIYVLSLTPCLDKTVTCDGFDIMKSNRVTFVRQDPGGKGINCARTLHALDIPVTLCGADFENTFSHALKDTIPCLFFETGKAPRVNLKIFDRLLMKTIEVNEQAPSLTDETLGQIREKVACVLTEGDVLVLCGSLPSGAPADTYAAFVRTAKEKGARVIADCSGAALHKVLYAGPDLIKPNTQEFAEVLAAENLQADSHDEKTLARAGQQLIYQYGIGRILLSLGKRGAMLISREKYLCCPPPDVQVRGDIGAGDAMSAAAAWCLQESKDDKTLLYTASAAAGAVLEKEGTQPPAKEDLERILNIMMNEENKP